MRENPMASDLRLVVSVIRATSTFERVGDLSLRVVKLAPEHHVLTANDTSFRHPARDVRPRGGAIPRRASRAWGTDDLELASAVSAGCGADGPAHGEADRDARHASVGRMRRGSRYGRSWLAIRSSASATMRRFSVVGSSTSSPATWRIWPPSCGRRRPCPSSARPSIKSSSRSAERSSGWPRWPPSSSRAAPRSSCRWTCAARSRSSRTTTARRAVDRDRGPLLSRARAAAADGERPSRDRDRDPSHLRDRAVARSHGQRGQRALGASTRSSSIPGYAGSSSG